MMVALQDQVCYSGVPVITVNGKKKRAGSVQNDDCLKYINELRVFPWFQVFLKLMTSFKMRKIEVTTTVDKVKKLLEGHPELIEGFNRFLPPEYKIRTSTSPPPPLVNLFSRKRKQPESPDSMLPKAIGLVNKVRERFGEDVYRTFLKIFSDCKRNKSSPQSSNTSVEDEVESLKKVAALFKGHNDFIQDFTPFLTTVPSTYDLIDLFHNLETCTPSYIHLPEDFPIPASTRRQDQSQVLNDCYVSFPLKGSKEKILSKREKREDDRFLLDLELGRVKSASKRIKDLLEEIETKRLLEIRFEVYLSQIDLTCIRRMKDHKRNHKMIDWLMKDAPNALPVILERLDERKQELEFLLDVELERVKSASKRIKDLTEEIETNKSEIRVEGYLSQIDLMCIKRMKDHKEGHRMIDWLMEDAQKALPVILERLEERKRELESRWAPQIKILLQDPSYFEKLKHKNSLLPQKNI